MGNDMEKVNNIGKMELILKGILKVIKSMVKDSKFLKMAIYIMVIEIKD